QCSVILVGFVYQAEDGIRDRNVTGVQTCALPISDSRCDLMSFWATFSGIVSLLRQGSGRSVDDRGRSTVSVHARPGPRGSQDPSSLVRRATGGHNGLMPELPEVDSLVEFLRSEER